MWPRLLVSLHVLVTCPLLWLKHHDESNLEKKKAFEDAYGFRVLESMSIIEWGIQQTGRQGSVAESKSSHFETQHKAERTSQEWRDILSPTISHLLIL